MVFCPVVAAEKDVASNILHTVHTACHPTLQHHNSYNRTENHRQWNAVWPPDDERKDARNMVRNSWLPINDYLLHLVGLTFIYLSKMHGHSNIKFSYKSLYSILSNSLQRIVVFNLYNNFLLKFYTGVVHVLLWRWHAMLCA